jgi:hypothetical protein
MEDRAAYERDLRKQLDAMQLELDQMRARTEAADAETEPEVKEQADQLQTKVDEGKTLLARLQGASDDEWAAAREEVEEQWVSLASGLRAAPNKLIR